MISFRQADLLQRMKPSILWVTFKYYGNNLHFSGIVDDTEALDEDILNRMKYLEDLIYEIWPYDRNENELYKEWSPDGPALVAQTSAIMELLKGKPRIRRVFKEYNSRYDSDLDFCVEVE
jgi:hypothetical protein